MCNVTSTPHRTAMHCNTLQHTATHRTALRHTAPSWVTPTKLPMSKTQLSTALCHTAPSLVTPTKLPMSKTRLSRTIRMHESCHTYKWAVCHSNKWGMRLISFFRFLGVSRNCRGHAVGAAYERGTSRDVYDVSFSGTFPPKRGVWYAYDRFGIYVYIYVYIPRHTYWCLWRLVYQHFPANQKRLMCVWLPWCSYVHICIHLHTHTLKLSSTFPPKRGVWYVYDRFGIHVYICVYIHTHTHWCWWRLS